MTTPQYKLIKQHMNDVSLFHEWTRVPGFHRDESGKHYTAYECLHCHTFVNHYDTAIWQESMEVSHLTAVCGTLVGSGQTQQVLALGRA